MGGTSTKREQARSSRLPKLRKQVQVVLPAEKPPTPLWKTWGFGVLAILVSVLLAAVLTTLGLPIEGVVVAVLCGLGSLAMGMQEGFVVGFLGLLIVSGSGIYETGAQDYPLFGSTVWGIPVSDAPAHDSAAVFHFTDGTVRTDFEVELPVYSGTRGTSTYSYSLYLVPIVPDGWTRETPVPAWAVSVRHAYEFSKAAWSQPYRAGVRVTSLNSGDFQDTIGEAERIYGLNTAVGAPIIRWMERPEDATGDEQALLAQIVAVCGVVWALVLAGSRMVVESRRRPSSR